MGYADASFQTFLTQTQDDMQMLAWSYYWERLGMLDVRLGHDVSTVDWCWTSGGAALEIQRMLDVQPLDGIIGDVTIAAINADEAFIDRVYGARVAYYRDLGFEGVYPGLFTRARACLLRSRAVAAP